MRTTVPIDKIVTPRSMPKDVPKPANASELQRAQAPILVDHEYRLIDGLRRLTALIHMGYDEVSVIVAETFDDAIEALKLQPGSQRDLPMRRRWEFYRALEPLAKERTDQLRRRPRALQSALAKKGRNWTTAGLGSIFGMDYEELNVLNLIYKSSMDPTSKYYPVAADLVTGLEAGELSLYGVRHKMFQYIRAQRKSGNAPDAANQRQVIERITQHMTALGSAAAEIEVLSPDISKDDLDSWAARLAVCVRQVRLLKIKIDRAKAGNKDNG